MDTLKVDRLKLLAKLEENLEKHRTEFADALEEWKREATNALKKAASLATRTGEITLDPLSDLPRPKAYTESYKNAIERISWIEDEYVELSDHEFASWIQDNWNWSGQFLSNTSLYSNAR